MYIVIHEDINDGEVYSGALGLYTSYNKAKRCMIEHHIDYVLGREERNSTINDNEAHLYYNKHNKARIYIQKVDVNEI